MIGRLKKKNLKNTSKEEKIFNYYILAVSIFLLVIFDQISKYLFVDKLFFKNSLIYIKYSKNFGSAFSIFSNFENYNIFIIFLSILVLSLFIYNYKYFLKNKLLYFSYIFAISGILGNLIDRIFLGFVQDFIGFKYLFIFNFADVYLNLALILFIISEFRNKNL